MNIMNAFKPSLASALISALCLACTSSSRAEDVDFAKDIQPILQKTCIGCHGPEKQKGKLRLDSKADAFKEDTVIVAGKADESELIRRITLPAGDDDIMPAEGDPLAKEQIELLRNWINQGALWPEGLVIIDPNARVEEKDPRQPVEPSEAEKKAVAQLRDLGVQVRPVAMNVNWSIANFRGVDTNRLDQALPLLADILTLEELNLAGIPIRNEHLNHISKSVNLTRLHLEKTPVTDAGLAHLKGLVNLKYLNLYNTQVSDAGMKNLYGLNHLKNLYLWQSQVTDDGAKALQEALAKTDINRGLELQLAQAEAEKPKEQEKTGEGEAKKEEKPEEKKEEPKKEEKKEEPKPEAKAEPEKKPEEKKDL